MVDRQSTDRRQGPRRESEQRAHLARELIIEKARIIEDRMTTLLSQQGNFLGAVIDTGLRQHLSDLARLVETLDDAEDTMRMEQAR